MSGEPLKPRFESLLRAMRTEEWKEEHDTADAGRAHLYHYVLPSFFQMLVYLKRSGRSFTLVFRTFGQDLPHVLTQTLR